MKKFLNEISHVLRNAKDLVGSPSTTSSDDEEAHGDSGYESSSSEDSYNEVPSEKEEENDIPLQAFTQQAGGHSAIFRVDDHRIAKACNPHEAKIYEAFKREPGLEDHTAKFYGVRRFSANVAPAEFRSFQTPGHFIILENLTARYRRPCVMDLKLGKRNFLEGIHSPYKVLLRTVKCSATTAKDFGVRVAGLKVYRPSTANYVVRQKAWGNSLKRKDLHKAINMYLHDGARTRVDVIPHFINKLKSLALAIEEQATFSFMASSVLLIYEGNTSDEVEQHVDIRLIDFDHTTIHDDGSAQDIAGVIFGIRSLVRILKKILYTEQMSRSETDVFNTRARDLDAEDIGTHSAVEPSVFSEKHLPYRTANKKLEFDYSDESSSFPQRDFSESIEHEETDPQSRISSQPVPISRTTTTTSPDSNSSRVTKSKFFSSHKGE